MDATDRLRALLDERGVEWEKPPGILEPIKTVWRSGPWEYEAIETGDGNLGVYASHCDWITPEQAVEATLGRGECKASKQRSMDGKVRGWQCHGCGAAIVTAPSGEEWPELPNYCPNCGRKVVE